MTAVTPSVTSAPIGGGFTVLNTVLNQGSTRTNRDFVVGIYLSSDSTITTGDTLIGSWSSDILAAGASNSNDTSVGISSSKIMQRVSI